MTVPSRPTRVHPLVSLTASYAWRLLVVAAAVIAVLVLIGKLPVTMLTLVVATFLSRVLVPVAGWLERRGLGPGLAAAVALIGFLLTAGATIGLIGIAVFNEADDIGPTISDAVQEIETWLVEDSPFPIDQNDVDRFRDNITSGLRATVSSSGGGLLSGVTRVFEGIVGLLLGLVITFFAIKDRRRFHRWLIGLAPAERRPVAERMTRRGWDTIGGYLRGAAALGVVEGVAIGLTLTFVGAELALPMAALTFIAAFVPFVGAIVAGVLAVLIALATAGLSAAVIVAVVAVLVQQFDNDLLAPLIYGKALSLHPVVVLLAITTGGSLFGLVGSFLAVPVVAVVVNVVNEARRNDVPPQETVTTS